MGNSKGYAHPGARALFMAVNFQDVQLLNILVLFEQWFVMLEVIFTSIHLENIINPQIQLALR